MRGGVRLTDMLSTVVKRRPAHLHFPLLTGLTNQYGFSCSTIVSTISSPTATCPVFCDPTYDGTAGFNANAMCCGCGGGQRAAATNVTGFCLARVPDGSPCSDSADPVTNRSALRASCVDGSSCIPQYPAARQASQNATGVHQYVSVSHCHSRSFFSLPPSASSARSCSG